MINQNEIWKDIPNYEGLYAASSLGRIMSYAKKVWTGFGYRIAPDRILSPSKMKTGYLCVALNKNKKSKTYTVHKLIALTFIPNPNNKEQIDHIDGHKTNNRIENLRWVSRKENMNNPATYNKYTKPRKNGYTRTVTENSLLWLKKYCKPVKCIETQKVYASINEAGRQTNIDARHICQACKKNKDLAGGYHWEYVRMEAC